MKIIILFIFLLSCNHKKNIEKLDKNYQINDCISKGGDSFLNKKVCIKSCPFSMVNQKNKIIDLSSSLNPSSGKIYNEAKKTFGECNPWSYAIECKENNKNGKMMTNDYGFSFSKCQ